MPQPAGLEVLVVVAVALAGGVVVVQVQAQQCTTSTDCTSPAAPHCSKWGWCQWTDRYGAEGPGGLQDGRCEGPQDCTPRAPVCSPQGFCSEGRQPALSQRPHQQQQPRLLSTQTADFNNEDDQLSEVVPNKRSFPSTDSQRPANIPQSRPSPFKASSAVGKSPFVISDYDPDYSEYYGNYDILKQELSVEEEDRKLDASIFGGNVELVTVASLTTNKGDTKQFSGNADHVTAVSAAAGTGNFGEELDVVEDVVDLPGEESEGCLVDCVNDCVSIVELRAYKDCVTFCGKSCD